MAPKPGTNMMDAFAMAHIPVSCCAGKRAKKQKSMVDWWFET